MLKAVYTISQMMIAQFGMPVMVCIIHITAVRADTIRNETIMIGVRSRSEKTPAAGHDRLHRPRPGREQIQEPKDFPTGTDDGLTMNSYLIILVS